MTESVSRARLMARIAGSLLSASIRNSASDDADPERLAQHFAADINRVVPLAQILVDVLKPASGTEQEAVNALVAPVAAELVAHNQSLLSGDDGDAMARLLKPSLNVLASFCDAHSGQDKDVDYGTTNASLLAMTPIIGCLSRYAFGKSPAKRLTDTLDTLSRAKREVLADLPKTMRTDPDLNQGLEAAAAQLFAAHFTALVDCGSLAEGKAESDAQFKELLAAWTQSLSLLSVLLRHAVMNDDQASAPVKKAKAAPPKADNVRTLSALLDEDEDDDDDDDEAASGGSGSGGGQKVKPGAGYNPMSFFAKKGL